MTPSVSLPLRVGARTLLKLRRRLVRRPLSLEEALSGELPRLPALSDEADGYLITSLPAALVETLHGAHPELKPFVRQRYPRSYASLEQGYDAYFAGFSAKSRSTLKRKLRKAAERCGGSLDLRCYRSPEEIREFYRHARTVSARTYQEKLLDAGLPAGEEALTRMCERAGHDEIRGWVLFFDGQPVSYLHAPAEGDTLVYAHLGYDPAFAEYSPGTVLQLEAMRQLMTQDRFRRFDFTEGDGQHKRQFATGALDCVDLLMVRKTLPNLLTAYALQGFDASVALAKSGVATFGLERAARAIRRS